MRAVTTNRGGQAPRRKRFVRALALAAGVAIYPVLSGFDLSHHVVPPAEIRDGGPAKDAIPAVREPQFVKAEHATFLESNDKVIGVVVGGRARAYPIKILNWHEVVDDSIAGTPLAKSKPIGGIEFVRIVALARIMMPTSFVRLSAGRSAMTDETQALCFLAGANSIFIGDTLLTAGNPEEAADQKLFRRLGLQAL